MPTFQGLEYLCSHITWSHLTYILRFQTLGVSHVRSTDEACRAERRTLSESSDENLMFRALIGSRSNADDPELKPYRQIPNYAGSLGQTLFSVRRATVHHAARSIYTLFRAAVHKIGMSSPLSALSQIVSSGISTIESTYATHGATFPSLDEPFQPPTFDDSGLLHPTQLVIAAAAQLIALLSHPPSSILDGASSVSQPI